MNTSETTTAALTDIYLDVLAECGYIIPTEQEALTYSVERGWHVPEPAPRAGGTDAGRRADAREDRGHARGQPADGQQ